MDIEDEDEVDNEENEEIEQTDVKKGVFTYINFLLNFII